MFTQFRAHYPTGSLISELLLVDRGTYLVRTLVQIGGVTLATGMAAASSIELAEDQSRIRAIAVLGIHPDPQTPVHKPQIETDEMLVRQTANHSNKSTQPATTAVSTSPQSSYFTSDVHHQSKSDTIASDASASLPTTNSTLAPETSDSSFSAVYGDTEELSSASAADADTWSGSYEHQPSQTNPSEMLDETTYTPSEQFDFLTVSNSITVELGQIGWDDDEEKKYLQMMYGQEERSLLENKQLLEFLHYLQAYGKTTVELKRLDWNNKQGREFLEQQYNKRSRSLLSCEQIQKFLAYLEEQP